MLDLIEEKGIDNIIFVNTNGERMTAGEWLFWGGVTVAVVGIASTAVGIYGGFYLGWTAAKVGLWVGSGVFECAFGGMAMSGGYVIIQNRN